jgi:hypothetical protein
MHGNRENTDRSKGLSAGQNYWTTLVKQSKLLDTLPHILLSQNQTSFSVKR